MNNKYKLATLVLALSGFVALPLQNPSPALQAVTVRVCVYAEEVLVATGSGVLVAKGEEYVVLTAKHVVDFAVADDNLSVKIDTYLESELEATGITLSDTHDVALVKFKSTKDYTPANISKNLPQPMRRAHSSSFPLGMFLTISEGIVNYSIANTLKDIWTCTAPAYTGSSGGGVYDAETKELIGISVMLGSRPVPVIGHIVVTHMHMFIPVVYIREFIGTVV